MVFAVGGIKRWRIDRMTAAASRAPAAPRAWPVTPLIDVVGGAGVAEHLAHGVRLGGVVERGRGAVGVDLHDVAGVEAGVVERQPHAHGGAGAAGRRGGDVVGVGVAAGAEHLGEDRGATALGVLPLLEHEHARAFAHHEAVAVDVERAGDPTARRSRSCW